MSFRLLVVVALALASPVAAAPLRIAMLDAEGGAAAIFVTPEGRSLLVDTGWPSGMPPGPPAADGTPAPPPPAPTVERIVMAMTTLGITRLDHVLITHYHLDHVGGLSDLLARVPVGQLIDHGSNREVAPAAGAPPNHPVNLYARYLAAIEGRPRRIVAPGEVLRIGSLRLDIVAGNGTFTKRPLRGAGGAGKRCDTPPKPRADDENTRSLGFVATFGRARILDLGDLTWDEEGRLVCPRDMLGRIDLLLVTHHGSALSSHPAVIATIAPRVALVANGARKGGDTAVYETLAGARPIPAVWYAHAATRDPAANPPPARIANLTTAPDEWHSLDVEVERDGSIRVTNGRTGRGETYRR